MAAATEGEAAQLQLNKLEVDVRQPLLEATRSSFSSEAVVHVGEVPAEGGRNLRLLRRAGIGAAVVLCVVGIAVRTLTACGAYPWL
jgi:hypothetical protein